MEEFRFLHSSSLCTTHFISHASHHASPHHTGRNVCPWTCTHYTHAGAHAHTRRHFIRPWVLPPRPMRFWRRGLHRHSSALPFQSRRRAAHVQLLLLLRPAGERSLSGKPCVHPSAVVDPSAEIGSGATVGPLCYVGASVRIGDDTTVSTGCTLQNCSIGSRVLLHPGVRIGQDGFGFLVSDDDAQHEKKPQDLRAVIGDDVEIGANSTVDRGSWRDTRVGSGTKIDNLVQVGHNVHIGERCLIAAQVGIAGSVTLGDQVLVGGQSGIVQHIAIGDGARIAAKSGVIRSVPAGTDVGGLPAVSVRDFHRQTVALARLAGRGTS